MSFGFKNVGHFFATVASDLVKATRAIAHVLGQIGKSETEVEAITKLLYPQAVPLERGAFALLGLAAQAVSDAGDAAAANGLNITLDVQLVADIKSLIPAIEAYAKAMGTAKPGAGR